MKRVLHYLLYMTPGLAFGALVFLVLLRYRRRRLEVRGLHSSALRECGVCLFWMSCGERTMCPCLIWEAWTGG